jgi:DNA topoisomerase-1
LEECVTLAAAAPEPRGRFGRFGRGAKKAAEPAGDVAVAEKPKKAAKKAPAKKAAPKKAAKGKKK